MDQDRVERETLYAEVWDTPMLTLAPKYGVSAVFLRRVCVRLAYRARREVTGQRKNQDSDQRFRLFQNPSLARQLSGAKETCSPLTRNPSKLRTCLTLGSPGAR
jgi:hypothetical protein